MNRIIVVLATLLWLGQTTYAQEGNAHYLEAGPPPAADELDKAEADTVRCRDTGWSAKDNRNTTHVTSLPNEFGTVLKSFTLYFSPGAGASGAVYPVQWSWVPSHSGNPVTVEITPSAFNLHIWGGTFLHGAYDAAAAGGAWNLYNEGYWRAVYCR
ncbi:MAG: hypothetical protein M9905_05345 [Rhizobiaceae bacterium]|nr:hypothetical protein [Rhizobiaceae bacterium]